MKRNILAITLVLMASFSVVGVAHADLAGDFTNNFYRLFGLNLAPGVPDAPIVPVQPASVQEEPIYEAFPVTAEATLPVTGMATLGDLRYSTFGDTNWQCSSGPPNGKTFTFGANVQDSGPVPMRTVMLAFHSPIAGCGPTDETLVEDLGRNYFLTAHSSGSSSVSFDSTHFNCGKVQLDAGFWEVSPDGSTDISGIGVIMGYVINYGVDCPPPAVCGNGRVESGEQCDDGNRITNDSCSNGCTLSICGDGILQTPNGLKKGGPANNGFEQCDKTAGCPTGYTCLANCTFKMVCGDGKIQSPEQCDDGNAANNDGCSSQCKTEKCGDAVVQTSEECDDGNTVDNDDCRNTCKLPVCGDKCVQPGEECDDGNQVDTDACSNACLLPTCGDKKLQSPEQCDDGNTVDTDACSNECKLPICGNGVKQTGEECDDGNSDDNDGCSALCKVEKCGDGIPQPPREECDGGDVPNNNECTATCKLIRCGDGVKQANEECDDGNNNNGDGCSCLCKLEKCGDGVVQPGEECDDRNSNNTDRCSNTCIRTSCGDGVIERPNDAGQTEECDGSAPAGYTCLDNCTLLKSSAKCGDSKLDSGEQCDDGNQVDTDSCSKYCKLTKCGDGILQKPNGLKKGGLKNDGFEQCDKNAGVTTGYKCLSNCTLIKKPSCGNKIVESGEQCDDGNKLNNDTCSSACKLTKCGDGIVQAPNGAGTGGPKGDGNEECDKSSGVSSRFGGTTMTKTCNSDCTLVDNPRKCNIIFTKTATPSTATAGTQLTYKITLKNNGTGDCTGSGVKIKESYDSQVKFVSANPKPTSGNNMWNVGTVKPGMTKEVTVIVAVNATACSTLTNKASFWADQYGEWIDITLDTNVTCTPAVCGNGKLEAAEQCDDGNLKNNDGCSSVCNKEGCGDKIIQPPEECDGSAPEDYICKACKLVYEPKVCSLKVKYTIKVENTGTADCTADDVQVKEIMANVTRSISPRSTNNQLSIGTLHPGQKKESSITFDIDPTKCSTAKKPGFVNAMYGLTTTFRESTDLCP